MIPGISIKPVVLKEGERRTLHVRFSLDRPGEVRLGALAVG